MAFVQLIKLAIILIGLINSVNGIKQENQERENNVKAIIKFVGTISLEKVSNKTCTINESVCIKEKCLVELDVCLCASSIHNENSSNCFSTNILPTNETIEFNVTNQLYFKLDYQDVYNVKIIVKINNISFGSVNQTFTQPIKNKVVENYFNQSYFDDWKMEVTLQCAEHFYNDSCNVCCIAQDNVSSCRSDTGELICKPGYSLNQSTICPACKLAKSASTTVVSLTTDTIISLFGNNTISPEQNTTANATESASPPGKKPMTGGIIALIVITVLLITGITAYVLLRVFRGQSGSVNLPKRPSSQALTMSTLALQNPLYEDDSNQL